MNVRDVEQNVQIGLRVIKSNWADAHVAHCTGSALNVSNNS